MDKEKYNEYHRQYLKNKYRNDNEFRKNHIDEVTKWSLHDWWVNKQIVLAVYTKQTFKCSNCECNNTDCLTLDHINNDGNNHGRNYRIAVKENFPDKYQVLCFNCNWIKELERRQSAQK